MTALDLMETLGGVEEELIQPLLNPARRRPRRAIRAALIAAAVLVLLALAALAASESGLLARFFPHSYDLIAEYVTHVEAVAENETLRLTLHEAVSDGYRTLVIYTVERLDGGGMAGWSPELAISPIVDGGNSLGSGSSSARTIGAGEASARTYLWTNSAAGDWVLRGVSLRLLGLKSTSGGERLDAGSLTAEAALKPCPLRMAERNADAGDGDFYVSILLSPLSLRIHSLPNLAGLTPEMVEIPGDEGRTALGPMDNRVELLFRDGSRRDVSGEMHHQTVRSSTGEVTQIGDFWDLPDVSRVKAVVIDGREYPLSGGEPPAPRQGLDLEASFLDNLRAWTYGDHVPAHPALEAEGAEVRLALDGVWTDGETTELLLEITGPQEEYWELVTEGGYLTFAAEDQRGRAMAVGAQSGGLADGLLSLVVYCSGKAAQLTIGDGDAALTIPLDMKKLKALPQMEAKAGTLRPSDSPETADALRSVILEPLFAGLTPDETGYSGDNGLYRLTAKSLYLAEEPGLIRLRLWLAAERVDGEAWDLMMQEPLKAFEVWGLKDGAELVLNGGIGYQSYVWGGMRWYALQEEFRYGDFSAAEALPPGALPTAGLDTEPLALDGLRLLWTPPEGGRITLDLPMTE